MSDYLEDEENRFREGRNRLQEVRFEFLREGSDFLERLRAMKAAFEKMEDLEARRELGAMIKEMESMLNNVESDLLSGDPPSY